MRPTLSDGQAHLVELTVKALSDGPTESAQRAWDALNGAGITQLFLSSNREALGLGLVEVCLVTRAIALVSDHDEPWSRFVELAYGNVREQSVAASMCRGSAVDFAEFGAAGPSFDPAGLYRTHTRRAARLCGLAERALAWSVERAEHRSIGGRSLLEHQSMGHRIARNSMDLRRSSMSIWESAWRFDAAEGASHLASVALAETAESAMRTARTMTQVFGAAGTAIDEVSNLYALIHLEATRVRPGDLWAEAARVRFETSGAT